MTTMTNINITNMSDIYISNGDDAREMTQELLKLSGAAQLFAPGQRVLIKPNLVVDKPASGGATTHPEIVEAIICFLKENGVNDIVIAEGSWVGCKTEAAFKACGYTELAARQGVELFDTQKDEMRRVDAEGMSLGICDIALTADAIINVPVLKGHCQTHMSCCLKNMKGLIPNSEKRRYHTIGLHEPIAALSTVLRPTLHVIDGMCGDRTFEEGGSPVRADKVLLGRDPVLLDSYAAMLLGYAPADIGYLNYVKSFGLGHFINDDTKIVELHPEKRRAVAPPDTKLIRKLAGHVEANHACSACYALLIAAMNESGLLPAGARVKIGQGFRGKKTSGFGCGDCTAGCDVHVRGCPPKTREIIAMLETMNA
jgi:uncharacterized protein (DUF362 family)